MYEEIVRIIGSYILNNKKIDKAYYYNIYDILADYLKLDDFVNGLAVNDVKIDPKESSVYSPKDKIITVNYYPSEAHKMLLDSVKDFNEMSYDYLNALLIVDLLIHEVNHAIRFNEIDNGGHELIDELIRKSTHVVSRKDFNNIMDYFKNDKLSERIYNNNHDLSPAESDADYLTLKAIKKLVPYLEDVDYSKVTLEYFLAFKYTHTFNSLRKKYKLKYNDEYTNSPSYDFCNMVRSKDIYKPEIVLDYNRDNKETFIKDKNKYSLEERLQYGLQLSDIELLDYSREVFDNIESRANYIRKYKS
jgi:hypothetical protein